MQIEKRGNPSRAMTRIHIAWISVLIGGSKTKFRLSFPCEETFLGRGASLTSSLREMYHARSALVTAFSTTQRAHATKAKRIHFLWL